MLTYMLRPIMFHVFAACDQKADQQVWFVAAYSLDQHFLTSYHHAILSVVLAQFSAKGFTDGADGIIRLVEASPYLKACTYWALQQYCIVCTACMTSACV